MCTARARRALACLFSTSSFFLHAAVAVADTPPARDASLMAPLERVVVVREAVARSPAVRAASQQAHATSLDARAEGSLPPPEAMAQVWSLDPAKPYAMNRASMIMVGIGQTFPAPGALDAREQAKAESARAIEAGAADRARLVARDAEHAFADYLEATSRHHTHGQHLEETRRLYAVAQARQAGGGALTDVTAAEVEVARVEADVATERARVETARARINALLARDPMAPLGPPVEGEPMVPAWSASQILAKARATRPELRAAAAETEARRLEARAADREATWPTFSVAGLYFPPVDVMPRHGFGANVAVSLPWLWGAADRRRTAQEAYVGAASSNAEGMRIQIDADVATAEANARSAAVRLQVMRDRAMPASRRSLDAAMSGYESGGTSMLTVLEARRALIDVEMGVVEARAALDHALAELDAAAGFAVPRKPLGPLAPESEGGHHHE